MKAEGYPSRCGPPKASAVFPARRAASRDGREQHQHAEPEHRPGAHPAVGRTPLAGLDAVHDLPADRPSGSVPLAFEGQELLLVNLVDAVDAGAERTRLEKLVADKSRLVAGFAAGLRRGSRRA